MRRILCCLGLAVMAVGIMPGDALGQHCRRSCEPGEGRDARGCCIPAKTEEKAPEERPGKAPDRTADRPPARAPEKPPARAPEKPPARVVEEPPARAPEKPPARAPEKPPARDSGAEPPARPAARPEGAGVRDRAGAGDARRPGSEAGRGAEPARNSGAEPSVRHRREQVRRVPAEEPAEPAREPVRARGASPGEPGPAVRPAGPGEQMRQRATAAPELVPPAAEIDLPAPGGAPAAPGNLDARPTAEQIDRLLGGEAAGPPGETRATPRRRWAAWMPWAVAGTGAAVTALGGGLYWRAAANYVEFDLRFDALCRTGCRESELPEDLRATLTRAEREEIVAKVSLMAGGAIMASGIALVLMNELWSPGKRIRAFEQVSLIPMISPDIAGMAAGVSF